MSTLLSKTRKSAVFLADRRGDEELGGQGGQIRIQIGWIYCGLLESPTQQSELNRGKEIKFKTY